MFDLSNAGDKLQILIKEAGKKLCRYYSSKDYACRQKAGVDFTTQADEEVDKFLRDSLKKEFPQSNFLTEETALEDYSSLASTENLWVIDPLDGTINFSRGNPNFAISVALMDKGETELGAVYLPASDKLYFARSDKEGASLNQSPIQVSQTSDLRETVVACDWAWDLVKRKRVVSWLGQICGSVRQIKSMGSAAADLSSLAEGRIDVYLHSGLKPWDTAAAAFIIQKAGGKVTLPNGSPWSPFNPDILASNSNLQGKILDLIK